MSRNFRIGAAAFCGFLSTIFFACSGGKDTPVSPGGPTTPTTMPDAAYSAASFAPLAGEAASTANAVNNAGIFAGQASTPAFSYFRQRAFVAINGNLTKLTELPASTYVAIGGISNGSTVYIAGAIDTVSYGLQSEITRPVRWALTPGGSIDMQLLSSDLGFAWGVNDDGDAIGIAGNNGYIWRNSGQAVVIAPPAGFTTAVGRAINNSGDAIFIFSSAGDGKSFLRMSNGDMIELGPPPGDTRAIVTALSDEVDGMIYVSGTSLTSNSTRALRWRVNTTTRSVTRENLDPDTESQGVSNSGSQAVRAFSAAAQRNFPRLWATDRVYALPLPQNTDASATATSISKNGKYVVGKTSVQGVSNPVLWTAK